MRYSDYLFRSKKLFGILLKAESNLLNGNKIKFQTTKIWRENEVSDFPDIYALYENDNLNIHWRDG
jgi:hypothetical protein